MLNREVDAATAEKMHPIFLEIIIAPSYSAEALAILTNKRKIFGFWSWPDAERERS